MKNRMKSTAKAVKNHFERNAFEYAISGALMGITALFIDHARTNAVKEFLASKGIDYEEFVNPEFYAEKQAQKELAA